MKCAAAPFLGGDVADRFGKVPAMTVKILRVVLTLAVRLVSRFSQNDSAVSPRSLAMSLGIFDPNLNDVRIVGYSGPFRDGEAAISGFHLNAMISNAQANSKAKSL